MAATQLVYLAHTATATTVGTTAVACASGQCGVVHRVGTGDVFAITDARVSLTSLAAGADAAGAWHVYVAGTMQTRAAASVVLADGSVVALPGRQTFVLQMHPNLTVENVLTLSTGTVDRVAVAGTVPVALHRAYGAASVDVALNGSPLQTITLNDNTSMSDRFTVCSLSLSLSSFTHTHTHSPTPLVVLFFFHANTHTHIHTP